MLQDRRCTDRRNGGGLTNLRLLAYFESSAACRI